VDEGGLLTAWGEARAGCCWVVDDPSANVIPRNSEVGGPSVPSISSPAEARRGVGVEPTELRGLDGAAGSSCVSFVADR